MRYDVAVIGGGPSGAVAAAVLAKAGISTVLVERNLENVKPCGGAIPLGLIEEFAIPDPLVEKKLSKMSVRSPEGRMISMEMPNGYVGMVRRERFDSYLRDRAVRLGADIVEALVREIKPGISGYTIHLSKGHAPIEADFIIGADGANSRTAEELNFPPNELQVIAMQQRFRYCDALKPYEELVEIWFDGEVSPDFYGWIFPKTDHIAIGTGTEFRKHNLKELQKRFIEKIGLTEESYLDEAAKIPMKPRKSYTQDKAILVGDAAGLVTPANGEGIFFAMRSGKLGAEAMIERIKQNKPLSQYEKKFRKLYNQIFFGLQVLQSVYYKNDRLRESFVAICKDSDVQRITFDSYLYKKMVPAPWSVQMKIFMKNIYHLTKGS
ncbi:geranylgeranyl diphosphate reductase [Prosthecochloris sp. HL-130-GSB]|jgi:geranylgeranyl diphosphate/geranylgeranyl-bacteriochlorophyllide a reductase|uniref:Geranylgeranyl diphosphate reductase n=1 Tax=Prosthecochloris aestuarii TaxID=1102 RepID=A0A831WVL4_PROAE|nr:geranylgeranyl diphosphate reductase [Prosthecochloris sp. HL-130-GSB]ARM30039.1 geranylgeranyl reductase [Prosthecochloris sp. HL-130-GSB]MBO8092354.1 geranylgeranyl diphosphate reductase [Prosthecochloris sp.]HED31706.1 geranylgeranyl diphosphate reductase [Prosthecochloris aestuarii]